MLLLLLRLLLDGEALSWGEACSSNDVTAGTTVADVVADEPSVLELISVSSRSETVLSAVPESVPWQSASSEA